MASTILGEALLTAQFLVEVTVLAVLQHHVDVLRVVEVSMQADNVWVIQSPLNFKLAFHLAEEVKLLKHVLEDNLQCTCYASGPLNSLKDLAEFSTAYGLYAREVMDGPAVPPLLNGCARSLIVQILLLLRLLIRTASCNFSHFFYSLKFSLIIKYKQLNLLTAFIHKL